MLLTPCGPLYIMLVMCVSPLQQCSLHDILDEDNVLQELKSQNKKLVDL